MLSESGMEKIIMATLLIVIMLFIILDMASLRWGVDSTDRINSPEWKRRQEWGSIIQIEGIQMVRV
jgi:hypothetical protein